MLLPFFQWLESLRFGVAVDESGYFVAAVNVAHLLSLTVFLGAVLMVDLRLLGRGIREQPLAQVALDAQPWLIGGFLAMLATGLLQLLATPMKAYYSDQFWLKMYLVLFALAFTLTVRRKVTQADETRLGPVWGKVVGLISIAVWVMIAVQGRLIGMLQ
ncbi:MAG: hypothetical protein A3H97_10040 [Acidobacteria bacterium RIFCSPLOWO2_02_FULL_65_29]|nr:MAG: hypothetical protein A3H97_10040 [Acidobacteria bacterium RIFCSPLOWO2_02_FULL_65_29]